MYPVTSFFRRTRFGAGGASVLRANIVSFAYLAARSAAAGAQRLPQAEGASMAGRAPQARVCSITRRDKLLYRVSEANEDGSKRPERSEGRLRSPVGANTMYSITRRGFRAPQARVRAPKALARRPFNIYIFLKGVLKGEGGFQGGRGKRIMPPPPPPTPPPPPRIGVDRMK